MRIVIDFGKVQLDAELFDTKTGAALWNRLPQEIQLTSWGNEAYGPIRGDVIPGEAPVPEIPAGGLAYSRSGNFFCIFFGQRPAWPVEYIGCIQGDTWEALRTFVPESVVVRKKE